MTKLIRFFYFVVRQYSIDRIEVRIKKLLKNLEVIK